MNSDMPSEHTNAPVVEEKTIVNKKKLLKLEEFYEEHPHGREKLTLGQKAADVISGFGGSWIFIILFLIFISVWIGVNLFWLVLNPIDPFPFILLNLLLSLIAALQAPVILMSQNRQAQRDRIKAERDYFINRKAEKENVNLQQDLDELKKMVRNIHTVTGCDKNTK
ncbi:MAG: DUF1003 domain-containing protein [Candidatus Diapherotrites archaeon]